MRQQSINDDGMAGTGAPAPRAGAVLRRAPRLLLAAAGACAALAIAACGNKPRSAQEICQDLEAAGVAARCHDTTRSACKYASERANFYLPGEGDKPGGQVLRFANGAQYDRMLKLVNVSKTGAIVEAKGALTLVQLLSDAPEHAAKAKAIVEKLQPVPSSQAAAPDPTCAK